jgi:hypothetical protein
MTEPGKDNIWADAIRAARERAAAEAGVKVGEDYKQRRADLRNDLLTFAVEAPMHDVAALLITLKTALQVRERIETRERVETFMTRTSLGGFFERLNDVIAAREAEANPVNAAAAEPASATAAPDAAPANPIMGPAQGLNPLAVTTELPRLPPLPRRRRKAAPAGEAAAAAVAPAGEATPTGEIPAGTALPDQTTEDDSDRTPRMDGF